MNKKTLSQFQLKAMTVLIAGICAGAGAAFAEGRAETLESGTVEVVGTTPLPGIGLPIEQLPANIQVVKGAEMQNQQSLNIADYMSQNLVGVNVNETQNNPYQPNVNFRGFTASPLLGTPQGLSVFFDGVRINEPFGDVVNWDLIPMNAIASMSMIPGSNPVYGLNTLGGAISLQTKSGRTHQGGAIEALAGSWNRKAAQFEYGGVAGNGLDYFIAGNIFDEDGWRDASPSEVKQVFGKLGWQNEKTDVSLTFTGANNDLIGNGLAPADMIRSLGWDSIYTKPDQTENTMAFVNLSGSHWLSDKAMFSGNVYYRSARTETLNGDGNDEYAEEFDAEVDVGGACDLDGDNLVNTPAEVACATAALAGETGVINRTKSKRRSYGFTAQVTFNHDLANHANQLTVGTAYDNGRTTFDQTEEFGVIQADRGILGDGTISQVHSLVGKSRTWSLFATDTFSINEMTHLTLSGRYNHTKVKNNDRINPGGGPGSLDADYTYNRFNPSVGLSITPSKLWNVYGSYNEGSRTPTAIELGCADINNPCKLPNAMASDPYLKQVVSRTFEVGTRGSLGKGLGWSASVYRTTNKDDIQFIAANPAGEGYFDNVGKTRRQGLDIGLNGEFSNFRWSAGYSYVKATYESTFTAINESNSQSDTDCAGNSVDGAICVNSGDRIPGIPRHQFKLRGEWQALPQWTIGTNVVAFSDQYAHGNENNEHAGEGGKVGGYTVVNLDTRYKFSNSGWQVFAKVNNLFDREYYSGAMLGANAFDASGAFQPDPNNWGDVPFYAPGAPRAGWVGVRYEFGGKKSSGTVVDVD